MKIYKKYINTDAESFYDLDDEITDEIDEEFHYGQHRIGGYSLFTQEDLRGYGGDYEHHTITLF